MALDDEDEDALEETSLEGLYAGEVMDNADPLFQYRVRVKVSNMFDEGTAWARPGSGMGGWNQRGQIMIPPIGANVLVHFIQGDPRHPVYGPDHHNSGGQLSHMKNPPRGGAVAAKDAYRLWGWEGDRYAIQVDERPGNEYLRIIDKTEGENARKMLIEMDVKMGVTAVYARTQLRLFCEDGSVVIKGKSVVINDRPVSNITTNPY